MLIEKSAGNLDLCNFGPALFGLVDVTDVKLPVNSRESRSVNDPMSWNCCFLRVESFVSAFRTLAWADLGLGGREIASIPRNAAFCNQT
jgi:hypothetical protein